MNCEKTQAWRSQACPELVEGLLDRYNEPMITVHRLKALTWVDVENPTREDIQDLIADYKVHPACAEELLTPSERAKVDTYEDSLYLVLHYPDHPAKNRRIGEIEINFVVMKDVLVTVHYQPIDILIEFSEQVKVDSVLDRNDHLTGGHLFFQINNLLYHELIEELEGMHAEIKKVEAQIFAGHELRMVEEISTFQRKVLDFRQALRYHSTVLKSFETRSRQLFGETADSYADLVLGEYTKVQSLLENERDLLKELRETNDSLLTAKNNDVTKKLTLMAFVTFPLTLIAILLGLEDSPRIFHGPDGFWVIVGILLVLLILMHGYFNYKKWI